MRARECTTREITALNVSSSCWPASSDRSLLTLDCTVHLFLFLISSTNLRDRTGRTLSEVGINWMLSLAVCLFWVICISKRIIRHPLSKAGWRRMLDRCVPGIPAGDYHDWGGQVGVRAKLSEVSLDQAAEGGTVRGITMQSLGSTPLLPLINTALQWKIHLAVFAVCFRKQAVPCLCSDWHALFMLPLSSVCLLLMQCCLYLKVGYSIKRLSVVAKRGTTGQIWGFV